MNASIRLRPEEDFATGLLTIDLGALARNYASLAARVAPGRTAAVVKADAYGLGVEHVAPALWQAGCRDFFVAHFIEALRLRPFLPEEARICVLNGLQPGAEESCATAGILPVLNSLEQIDNWARTARQAGRRLPALLQFDTGMSRLGLSQSEVAELVANPERLADIELRYVMSHLAAADAPDSPQNASQLAAMRAFAGAFAETELSFANSAGIFLGPDFHGVLARPGIALYGGAPVAGVTSPMEAVVRLDVPVVQCRTVPVETLVGYGGAWSAKAETRLATISAGYADGLLRSLSDRGACYYDGVRLPIVGRVSMDSMTLDVSALPPGTLALGSMVEVIGPNQSLEALAADAGTISWEMLTGLGPRYRRRYI